MMNKRAVLIVLFTIICISLISSISADDRVDKAYECLESKLGNNCASTQNTEQSAFSLIASSYNSSKQISCLNNLNSKKKVNGDYSCFGITNSASCDLKSTALAVLALDYIGQNTDSLTSWILEQKARPTGLNWFLEIDSNEATTCDVEINNQISSFTIGEDKKISGTSNCLIPSLNNYFLQVNPDCYDYLIQISCDKNFITTLLYQKSGESTFYISSTTHSAQAYDVTQEEITSFCLGINGCDYQGSLWASLALDKTGEDIADLIPYLKSESSNNQKYLPSSFLYMITNENDYLSKLNNRQIRETFNRGYWNTNSGNGLYYDTALALLGLQSISSDSKTNAQNYLFKKQDDNGCWNNNIRDTSFILYSSWPRNAIEIEDCIPNCEDKECGDDGCGGSCGTCSSGYYCSNGNCINDSSECEDECDNEGDKVCSGKYLKTCGNFNEDSCLELSNLTSNLTKYCSGKCENGACVNISGGEGTMDYCEDSGFYCTMMGDCSPSDTLDDYYCPYLSDVCCETQITEKTCSEKGGQVCPSDKECSTSLVSSSDTNNCCLGYCEEPRQESECELNNGKCTYACSDDEEEKPYDCDFASDVCCAEKTQRGNWLLIILLIILIILVVLAIIFRNQLKIWLFKIKNKFKSGKGPSPIRRPPMPPGPPGYRGIPQRPRPMPRHPPKGDDNLFDDTMKKLRDMTK